MEYIEILSWVTSGFYVLFPYVYHWGSGLKRIDENAPLVKRFVFVCMVVKVLVLWMNVMLTVDLESFVWMVPMSLFVADFLAGMVHLVGDVTEQKQFIRHHLEPTYMCGRSYLHHTFRSYVLVVMLLYFFEWSDFWVMTFMWTLQANETHVWLHAPASQAPYFIRGLQKVGLLMTGAMHKRHHVESHDRNFCTLNGWANGLVNIFAKVMFKIKRKWKLGDQR